MVALCQQPERQFVPYPICCAFAEFVPIMERRRRLRRPPSRPLVLVAEDHDDTRELYLVSLSASGFEVISLDGAQAFTRVWETHPDIIVTDLMLHPRDGFDLLRDLKRDPRTRQIPVVVVTGHAAPVVREQAERECCARFFVKPFPPD